MSVVLIGKSSATILQQHGLQGYMVFLVSFTNVMYTGDAGKQVSAYFPPAKWYDWFSHQVTSASGGKTITIDTPLDHIPVSSDHSKS